MKVLFFNRHPDLWLKHRIYRSCSLSALSRFLPVLVAASVSALSGVGMRLGRLSMCSAVSGTSPQGCQNPHGTGALHRERRAHLYPAVRRTDRRQQEDQEKTLYWCWKRDWRLNMDMSLFYGKSVGTKKRIQKIGILKAEPLRTRCRTLQWQSAVIWICNVRPHMCRGF